MFRSSPTALERILRQWLAALKGAQRRDLVDDNEEGHPADIEHEVDFEESDDLASRRRIESTPIRPG